MRPPLLILTLALLASADVAALNLVVSRSDMTRALALARWPHTDAERARFHDRYLTIVDPSINLRSVIVQQIEVITEFRRLELIAEGHARLNDLFGRSGVQDAEEALKPCRCLAG